MLTYSCKRPADQINRDSTCGITLKGIKLTMSQRYGTFDRGPLYTDSLDLTLDSHGHQLNGVPRPASATGNNTGQRVGTDYGRPME